MLDKKVLELLNLQIQKEFYSAYLYLDFANYFEDAGLDGFANWYRIQAQEEKDHAMLFLQYMQNNGASVKLLAIDEPKFNKESHLSVLQEAYKHEVYVTSSINDIYHVASDVKDYRTMQFLDWFIKEQGEEEKTADDIVKKFELFGKDAQALYSLNVELGGRTYTTPSLVLD